MRLQTSNTSFFLTILGYQYPDAEGEPYDANWLRIRIDAVSPQGGWSATDPALLTHEADRLADWLEQVQAGTVHTPAISFLEPMLLFRLRDEGRQGKVLRVHFGPFVRPSWGEEGGAGQEKLWLDFPLQEVDLAAAARELRSELKRYPKRYER